MVSVFCWAAYTLGAGRLMARHSPLYVTGMTMAIGAVPYVLLALPAILRTDWSAVRPMTYVMLVLSALLALNVAYLIWYIAVQKIGAVAHVDLLERRADRRDGVCRADPRASRCRGRSCSARRRSSAACS